MKSKGQLVLSCNGERLDIEDIWLERGAIWVRASTGCVVHGYESGTPTTFEVYGADGSLVQRPMPGSFNTDSVTPGYAWVITMSMTSNRLMAELEAAAP